MAHSCVDYGFEINVVGLHPSVGCTKPKPFVRNHCTAFFDKALQRSLDFRLNHAIVREVQHLVFAESMIILHAEIIDFAVRISHQSIHPRVRVSIMELRIRPIKGVISATAILNRGH
jgi:hypothetical protein